MGLGRGYGQGQKELHIRHPRVKIKLHMDISLVFRSPFIPADCRSSRTVLCERWVKVSYFFVGVGVGVLKSLSFRIRTVPCVFGFRGRCLDWPAEGSGFGRGGLSRSRRGISRLVV